jgi:hypothetical protein
VVVLLWAASVSERDTNTGTSLEADTGLGDNTKKEKLRLHGAALIVFQVVKKLRIDTWHFVDPKVHYRVQKNSAVHPIMGQMNPGHIIPCFFVMYFNITRILYKAKTAKCLLSFGFSNQNFARISRFTLA